MAEDDDGFGKPINVKAVQEGTSPKNPVNAKKGLMAKGNEPTQTERGEKMMRNEEATHEKLVGRGVKRPGTSPRPECDCLTRRGLALDTVNNRIYVANATLFQELYSAPFKFSITITDGCGVTSCKNVTINIGPDNPAVYVDVKNNSYLNNLSNGDVIGYSVDPDGSVVQARIVIYNETSGLVSSPVTPSLLLPPGMRFNKYTGEITVVNASTGIGPVYTTDSKSKQAAVTMMKDGGSFGMKRLERRTMFRRTGANLELNGIGSKEASSGLPNKALLPDNAGELPFAPVAPDIWITAPGIVQVGKWPIHVLTTDIYGGTTIIKYIIEVKKSAVLGGISVTEVYNGYQNVKVKMKETYGGILKAEETVLQVKAVDTSSLEQSQSETNNKAQ